VAPRPPPPLSRNAHRPPGQSSIGLPDLHSGYGFAIGNTAACKRALVNLPFECLCLMCVYALVLLLWVCLCVCVCARARACVCTACLAPVW
jgi:hypothetical protein